MKRWELKISSIMNEINKFRVGAYPWVKPEHLKYKYEYREDDKAFVVEFPQPRCSIDSEFVEAIKIIVTRYGGKLLRWEMYKQDGDCIFRFKVRFLI